MQVQYDPALYIGCIVDFKHMDHLRDVSKLHAEIAFKKEGVNHMQKLIEEFDILRYELYGEKGGDDEMKNLKEDLKKVLTDYWNTAKKNYKKLSKLTKSPVTHSIESPIDWEKSKLKEDLPIAANTMKCDARWFMVDQKSGGASKYASSIGKHIKGSLGLGSGGFSIGGKAASMAMKTSEELHSTCKVLNTLVISCMCTHKNAMTIAPCVFDMHKLIQAWNEMFPKDRLPRNRGLWLDGRYEEKEDVSNKIYMVRGASYASAVVGMVTFVDESHKRSTLDLNGFKSSMEANLKFGGLLNGLLKSLNIDTPDVAGGYGSEQFSEMMNMFASQTIAIHFNLYCAGFIPHLQKQKLSTKVKMLGALDTSGLKAQINDYLESVHDKRTTKTSARNVNTNTAGLKAQTKDILRSLHDGQTTESSVLNVNTMMNAFDDYISKATAGDVGVVGVPVNYFLMPISRFSIIDRCWEESLQGVMDETANIEIIQPNIEPTQGHRV